MNSNNPFHFGQLEDFKRIFTKRQRAIMHFIFMLSHDMGKEVAIIPKLQDFTLCGVSPTKIRDELKNLEAAKVIYWNEKTNEFKINTDSTKWEIQLNQKWNEERFQLLLDLNKRHMNWL